MDQKTAAKVLCALWLVVGILPVFFASTPFVMQIFIMCLLWSVVALCWDLIMGFAGIFSFGQVAFFVIGGYASAIISINYAVDPLVAVFLAGGLAALLGVLVGLVCLRLRGAYIALVTFAVHMILEPLLKGEIGQAIGTGGALGLLNIPPVTLFSYTFTNEYPLESFYFLFVMAVLASVVVFLVIRSHWGKAFLALKDAEEFAVCLGVSAFRYKLKVFALTSFLTGMTGGLYAHYIGVLSTRILGIDLFVMLMIMLVIGGVGKFPGAIVGAFITVLTNELLAPLGVYRPVILGALVVVLVLVLPDGIVGLTEKIITRRQGKNFSASAP